MRVSTISKLWIIFLNIYNSNLKSVLALIWWGTASTKFTGCFKIHWLSHLITFLIAHIFVLQWVLPFQLTPFFLQMISLIITGNCPHWLVWSLRVWNTNESLSEWQSVTNSILLAKKEIVVSIFHNDHSKAPIKHFDYVLKREKESTLLTMDNQTFTAENWFWF